MHLTIRETLMVYAFILILTSIRFGVLEGLAVGCAMLSAYALGRNRHE